MQFILRGRVRFPRRLCRSPRKINPLRKLCNAADFGTPLADDLVREASVASCHEAPRFSEIRHRHRSRHRHSRPGGLVAGQGAVAQGDAAARHRERAEQSRHPGRRHQPARLRGVVELLRPADHPRDEDAARRHAVLRPRQVHARTCRGDEGRRHVGHLQAEEGRQIPRRHAGHRQGRQMVVRPRDRRRRLSRPSR